MIQSIPIFYRDEMATPPTGTFSPSAEKPSAVVASWQRLGIPLEICAPAPVSAEQIALAHEPTFVRDILACRRANGFGTRDKAVAAALPYTSGAMLAAARRARSSGAVAAAPCSGFHHASYARASGFCTFNGLMVTACVLLSEGVERIGILDFDYHEGDGTNNIIAKLELGGAVHHYTAGPDFFERRHADAFFEQLPKILDGFRGCEVVLYQAGADPHIDDPLGGFLTSEGLRRRDATVFETCAARRIPVAWNLAGGYQRDLKGSIDPVLAIHDQTLIECARVYLASP